MPSLAQRSEVKDSVLLQLWHRECISDPNRLFPIKLIALVSDQDSVLFLELEPALLPSPLFLGSVHFLSLGHTRHNTHQGPRETVALLCEPSVS